MEHILDITPENHISPPPPPLLSPLLTSPFSLPLLLRSLIKIEFILIGQELMTEKLFKRF